VRRDTKPDQGTPVLTKQCYAGEAECLYKRAHPGYVAGVRIVRFTDRFIGLTETNEVRRNDSVACVTQVRDHVPIQVRPARFSVQQQDCAAIARAFINVVHANTVNVGIMRFEIVIRQILETAVRGSEAGSHPGSFFDSKS
jgi:hypothetical protein